MRALLVAVLLAVCAVTLVGCKNRSLVGTWMGNQAGVPAEFTMNGDGTMSISASQGGLTFTGAGNYKLDGDQLTITLTSLDAPGLDAIPMAKAQIDSFLNKPNVMKVEWVSDNEIKMSNDTGEQTWTRKES